MGFQPDPGAIVWRLHLESSPDRVFDALDSDAGRDSFWAESAEERDGSVQFVFVDGERCEGRILERRRPECWSVEYFGYVVEFRLEPDGEGGTDLRMSDRGIAPEHVGEVTAGWLNVLLPMKAMLDFGVDLHNHDPSRSWRQGYVDH